MKALTPLWLLGLLFYVATPLSAQKHLITLEDETIEVTDFNYSVKRVIDARPDTTNIGFITKGNLDTRFFVDLEGGFVQNFGDLLNRSFNSLNEKTPLVVRVNRFFVYNLNGEQGNFNFAEINLDFYVRKDGVWYREFQAGNYEVSHDNNTSKRYESLLTHVVASCFEEFKARMIGNLGYHQRVDEDEMNHVSPDGQFSKMVSMTYRQRGIYHTYNDFRDNITDIGTPYLTSEVRGSKSDKSFLKLEGVKKRKIEDIWGIYQDGTAYINIFGVFAPFDITDSSLYIPSMPHPKTSGETAVWIGIGGLAFGAIGGVAVAVISTDGKDSPMDPKQPYKVDPATGMAVPVDKPDYKSKGSEIIFYTEKIKPEGQKIEVFIDGNYRCTLTSASYAKIDGLISGKEIEICIRSQGEEYCESLMLDQASAFYVETELKKNGKMNLFPKKSESSISYIDHLIEKGKLKEIKPVEK